MTGATTTAGRWRPGLQLAAGIGIVAAFAATMGLSRSLWMDEAYSLDTAARPLADTVRQAIGFEFQPPLYFALLHGWLRIGGVTVEAGRLLSTVAVVLALVLLHRVARRWATDGAPVSPALLCAAIPFSLWAAVECRAYGLAILTAALTIAAHFRLVDAPPERRWRWIVLYAAAALAGLATFYYSGFLLAGLLGGGLLRPGRRRDFAAVALLVALALVPWAPVVLSQARGQLPSAAVDGDARAGVFQAADWIVGFVTTSILMAPLLKRGAADWVVLAGLVGLIAAAARRARPDERRDLRDLALAAAIPAVVLCGFRLSGALTAEARYFAPTIPAVALLVARALASWPAGRGRWAATGAVAVVLLGCLASFLRNFRASEDWKGLAAALAARGTVATPVLVFDGDAVAPLRYYLGRATPLFGVPNDPHFEARPLPSQRLRDAASLVARIDEVAPADRPFWLVRRQVLPQYRPELLDVFVADSTTVSDRVAVTGLRADLLRRTHATPASAGGPDRHRSCGPSGDVDC